MSRVTRVSSRSNETSNRIEETSPLITDVIPRDTSVSTERYIIFTEGELTLPDVTRDVIENLGFSVRDMQNHAIDYEHAETKERATFLAMAN